MQIRKLFPIFFLSFLFGCSTEKKEINSYKKETNVIEEFLNETILDRKDFRLQGNVHSTLEYEFLSGEISNEITNIKGEKYHFISVDSVIEKLRNIELKASYSCLFNEFGQLTKDIRYIIHNKNFLENIEEYEFDNHQKLLEWNKINIDNDLAVRKTFVYDDKNRLVEFIENYFFDEYTTKIEISYKNDTVIMKDMSNMEGDSPYFLKTEYDKYGDIVENNPREDKEYDKNGNLIKMTYEGLRGFTSPFSITYDYDYKGNKIEKTEYDSINSIVCVERYFYNKKNELIQSIKVDTSATEIKRYDEYQHVHEYTLTSLKDNNRSFYSFWVNHDKYGNVIKRVNLHRDSNGIMIEEVIKTELEYDEVGNWIIKRVLENDSLTTLFEREIRYF